MIGADTMMMLVLKDTPRYLDLVASGWGTVKEYEACGRTFVILAEPGAIE